MRASCSYEATRERGSISERYVVETWVRATLGKSILVHELISITEWVLQTLDRKSHVAVRDIHVHLCVCGTRYKRCLIESCRCKGYSRSFVCPWDAL